MENSEIKTQSYLVGWKHKLTGTIYRNMCTQTGKHDGKNDKRTQTNFMMDKFTNVECDVEVQTNFFPNVRDRFIKSFRNFKEPRFKDYSNEKILESIVKIQRFYR